MPLPARLLALLHAADALRKHAGPDGDPMRVRRPAPGPINAANVDGWSNALARVTAAPRP